MPYHVSDDAGRRVVGIAFRPGSLAMQLKPSWRVRLSQLASSAIVLAGVRGLLIALVCVEARRMVLPFIVIGLAMLVIAADDASFLGGQRPFDGGDDGIHYDGLSRIIVEKFQADDFYGALEGSEKIFYYGGPGLTLCPRPRTRRSACWCLSEPEAWPSRGFALAFLAALLLAFALLVKPIVAPAAAVLLAGSALAAISHKQFARVAGLCIGFTPVLLMALHNWVYGHVFVPFQPQCHAP